MPLLRHHVRLHVIEATPEQVSKGVAETTDLFRRARDICRDLELPATEVRHVATHLDSQIAMLVNEAQEKRNVARGKAIDALVQKDHDAYVAEVTKATNERIARDNAEVGRSGEMMPMFGGDPPYPNLGHHRLGVPSVERGPWLPMSQSYEANPHDALALQQMYSPGGILHRSPAEERRLLYLELDDKQLNERLKVAGLPTL